MTASTSAGSGTTADGLTVPPLSPMVNRIQGYDWGSTTALAQMQNRPPSGDPEAELWMGAHPGAPSDLHLESGRWMSLTEVIGAAPAAVLGAATAARFGPRLPYLLKVLAIARPLSVQVHPDAARAREAYLSDGESPYVDAFHKPEMLYALEPIEALFGFRAPSQSAMLLGRLECDRLTALIEVLRGPDRAEPAAEASRLHAALSLLVHWPVGDRAALVAEIATASRRLQATGGIDYPEAFGWVDRLVGLHPADPMVLAPLLLDLVKLSPGQTLFVPAGVPHCYLSGLGVEILAASDNVLRCGLTSKFVDTTELLRVIDCRPTGSSSVTPVKVGPQEIAWRPAVEDFQLSLLVVDGAPVVGTDSLSGPQVIFCSRGKVEVQVSGRSVQLTSGSSAFVAGTAGPITFSGEGEIFRAAPGLPTT